MKSLKEFAAALFEDAAAGFGDGGEAKVGVTNKDAGATGEKMSKHAMKVSDSTPVADPGKKASLTVSEGVDEPVDEMTQLEEELKAMMSEMGDGAPAVDEEAPMLEVTEEEVVAEAAKAKRGALAKKLHALKEEQKKLEASLKECGEPVNITIEVEGPATVSTVGPGTEGNEEGDMDLDVVGDEEEGDDGDIEILPDEEGEMEEPAEPGGEEEEKSSLATKKALAENAQLKGRLNEMTLAMSTSLYLNKLFANENLSKDQKRKIVEYFDCAKNLNEVKETYARIKRALTTKLNEAKKPQKVVGSGAAPSRRQTLNEGAPSSLGQYTVNLNRWAQLAGIQVKKP